MSGHRSIHLSYLQVPGWTGERFSQPWQVVALVSKEHHSSRVKCRFLVRGVGPSVFPFLVWPFFCTATLLKQETEATMLTNPSSRLALWHNLSGPLSSEASRAGPKAPPIAGHPSHPRSCYWIGLKAWKGSSSDPFLGSDKDPPQG